MNYVLIAFVAFVTSSGLSVGGDQIDEDNSHPVEVAQDHLLESRKKRWPICGLMAMKVASQATGGDIALDNLLTKKYLSNPELGSTTQDLLLLASDNGLHTAVYSDLEIGALKVANSPFVLNLKARSDSKCGGHWVTFLGFEGREAVIYDSLRAPSINRVNPSDLLTRWDGVAIQVSDSPPELLGKIQIGLAGMSQRIVAVLVCVVAICVCSCFSKNHASSYTYFTVLMTSVAAILFVQCTDENSIVKNRMSAGWMALNRSSFGQSEAASFYEISEIIDGRNSGIIVDARTLSAVSSGVLIPGSIHIGVDFDIVDFRRAISNLDKGGKSIVFCNSKECAWAEIVASRLRLAGFERVKIFHRGVVGYQEEYSLKLQSVDGD